jgi:hypothetical protein
MSEPHEENSTKSNVERRVRAWWIITRRALRAVGITCAIFGVSTAIMAHEDYSEAQELYRNASAITAQEAHSRTQEDISAAQDMIWKAKAILTHKDYSAAQDMYQNANGHVRAGSMSMSDSAERRMDKARALKLRSALVLWGSAGLIVASFAPVAYRLALAVYRKLAVGTVRAGLKLSDHAKGIAAEAKRTDSREKVSNADAHDTLSKE